MKRKALVPAAVAAFSLALAAPALAQYEPPTTTTSTTASTTTAPPTTTPPVTSTTPEGTTVTTYTITVDLGGTTVTAQVTRAPGDNVAANYTLTGLEPGETYTLVLNLVVALNSSGGDVGNSAAKVPTNIALPAQTTYTATATADASGNAAFSIPMTGIAAGEYEAVLSDSSGNSTVLDSFTITEADVAAAAGGGTGTIPTTGSNSTLPMTRIGAVLIASGAVAVFAARKRRQGMIVED